MECPRQNGGLWQAQYRRARRIAVAVIGGTVVLIGMALIVLPGPGSLVIPAGLAILATEFEFARRWLRRLKEMLPRRNSRPPKAAEEC